VCPEEKIIVLFRVRHTTEDSASLETLFHINPRAMLTCYERSVDTLNQNKVQFLKPEAQFPS